MKFGDAELIGVPTIVVVDRAGVVREKKEGVLSDGEQHALLELLTKLPTG